MSECNIGRLENLDIISDYQLVKSIDAMLIKLNLIPFTQTEINDISSNMN